MTHPRYYLVYNEGLDCVTFIHRVTHHRVTSTTVENSAELIEMFNAQSQTAFMHYLRKVTGDDFFFRYRKFDPRFEKDKFYEDREHWYRGAWDFVTKKVFSMLDITSNIPEDDWSQLIEDWRVMLKEEEEQQRDIKSHKLGSKKKALIKKNQPEKVETKTPVYIEVVKEVVGTKKKALIKKSQPEKVAEPKPTIKKLVKRR
jgi:hypothetical protein